MLLRRVVPAWRRAYSGITAADFLRVQAVRGANMEPDPRGVDYDLFEAPTREYAEQKSRAPDVPDVPAPVSAMQRVLRAGDFALASKLWAQLDELGTLLDTPLPEYAHAARWCALHGDAARAVQFMQRVPPAQGTGTGTSTSTSTSTSTGVGPHTTYQLAQALQWLARGDDLRAIEQGMLVAAALGHIDALARAVPAVYQGRFGGSERALPAWRALVDTLRDERVLTDLYGRVLRAQVRGRHTPLDTQAGGASASRYAFPLHERTLAALRGVPLRRARMSAHDSERFLRYARVDDLARMRSVLLGVLHRGAMPSIEHVATLLCMAARHTHIEMPPSEKCAAHRVSTGTFLKPLRRQCMSFPGLWETATLRAREKDGDWPGALRLWQRRFEPVCGVRQASVDELLARAPGSAPAYAASVAANSDRRPERAWHAKPRIMPTPYAVATVLRALVRACGPSGRALAPLYAAFADSLAPGGVTASAACFEAFIAMSSRVDVKRFVSVRAQRTYASQLPTMWTMLRDMRAVGVVPRTATWTLFLQAMLRDRSRSRWRMVQRVLHEMHKSDAERGAFPRATPATYAGLLHVLARVRQTPRTRWRRRAVGRLLARRCVAREAGGSNIA